MVVNELQDGGKITVKTLDEQEHVNMLLDILRGVNLQDKLAIRMTIASFHPHCVKAMEESEKRQAKKTAARQGRVFVRTSTPDLLPTPVSKCRL